MAHRVAPLAESDLDGIWYYIANESGSIEIADRVIDSITSRFLALSRFPYMGRSRDEPFGVGFRSFSAGEYTIVYTVEGKDVLILRVAHGHRDIESLFLR